MILISVRLKRLRLWDKTTAVMLLSAKIFKPFSILLFTFSLSQFVREEVATYEAVAKH